MTLLEYQEELKKNIDVFVQHWIAMHNSDPEAYPLEFPDENAGNWDEQFLMFVNSDEQ